MASLPVDGSNTNHLKSTFSGATPYRRSDHIAFTVIAKTACKDWWEEMSVCVDAAKHLYSYGYSHPES